MHCNFSRGTMFHVELHTTLTAFTGDAGVPQLTLTLERATKFSPRTRRAVLAGIALAVVNFYKIRIVIFVHAKGGGET